MVFIVFLLEDHFFWGLKASVVPFRGRLPQTGKLGNGATLTIR
jgi:hypothetical protein